MARGQRMGGTLAAAVAVVATACVPAGAATATRTAAGAGVTATLTVTVPSRADLPRFRDASLSIARADGGTTVVDDARMRWEYPGGNVLVEPRALQVVDLEGDDDPEVLFNTFWGGAHCCYQTRIFRHDAATGGYRMRVRTWGDPQPRLTGLGGPTPEFLGADERFAYALGVSYAESAFPVRTWAYRNGALVVTTGSHPALVRRDRAGQWRDYRRARRDGLRPASYLAAYLADAMTLGEGTSAWRRVRAAERGHTRMLTGIRRQLVRWGYR